MARIALSLVTVVIAGCSAREVTSDTSATANLTAATEPFALDGDFRFRGNVAPIGRLTTDVVDDRQPDAASRLDQLNADGAACMRVDSSTTRCTKLHSASEVPQTSLDWIAAHTQGVFATFGTAQGAPSVVTQGDAFTEWSIQQPVTTKDGTFAGYAWRDLDGDTQKLVIPTTQPTELVVQDAGHLGLWSAKVTSESRWRFHQDMAFAVLTK